MFWFHIGNHWWSRWVQKYVGCGSTARHDSPRRGSTWASYQIRKIAGCACAGNAGNVFPRRRFQRKPLVSDPGMHHGTCVTHVPWCMSGSRTRGGGENVPGIPGACAPAISRIWQEAHGTIAPVPSGSGNAKAPKPKTSSGSRNDDHTNNNRGDSGIAHDSTAQNDHAITVNNAAAVNVCRPGRAGGPSQMIGDGMWGELLNIVKNFVEQAFTKPKWNPSPSSSSSDSEGSGSGGPRCKCTKRHVSHESCLRKCGVTRSSHSLSTSPVHVRGTGEAPSSWQGSNIKQYQEWQHLWLWWWL